MSNTRHIRELNGGKLTRPKRLWKGRQRATRSRRAGIINPAGMGGLQSMAAAFTERYRQQKTG